MIAIGCLLLGWAIAKSTPKLKRELQDAVYDVLREIDRQQKLS